MSVTPEFQRVVAVLVKPTNHNGVAGDPAPAQRVLPSYSLGTLYSMACRELARILPPEVKSEIHVFDEHVACHAEHHEELLERFPEEGSQLVVGMVAVETAQFPRACDLVKRWQARGATCVVGALRVDGTVTMMYDGVSNRRYVDIRDPQWTPEELQELVDRGTVIIHGEAEALWGQKLADIVWWSRCLAWA